MRGKETWLQNLIKFSDEPEKDFIKFLQEQKLLSSSHKRPPDT
jgi:hypothetical protein